MYNPTTLLSDIVFYQDIIIESSPKNFVTIQPIILGFFDAFYCFIAHYFQVI